MSAPSRFTSGITQDASFQPLGRIGIPDPFFYATYEDDFIHYNTGDYTVTAVGGSVAASAAAGSGGRILFTTGATATNFAAIQLAAAPFASVSGTRLAYLTRVRLTDITNSVFLAGLMQTSATPFTVVNGIVVQKAAASTDLVVNVVVASANVGTATLSGYLTNATDVDIGFMLNNKGVVEIWVGSNLIGNKPNQDRAVLGPVAKITPTSLPAVLLNPTLAIQAGTAAAQTMYADFQLAAQER